MSQSQQNLLNEYQIKILQCIKEGISHQQDISKNLGLENHLVNYYLDILKKDELIEGFSGYGKSGELEYILTTLTNKGKVALDNPNNLIQETNMKEHRTINTNNYSENIGIRNMNGGEINEGAKIGGIINEAESKKFAIAVEEVQEILDQLSNTYPIHKTTDKMVN